MAVIRDIPFAEYPGFRPVTLDLHLPEQDAAASGPVPVILQLHGGGWRVGRRGVFTPHVSEADSFGRIVAAGFAVVAADYRLSGEAVYPAQLEDVHKALAWILDHGPDHGLDPTRIVLWGGSAGSTLAALTAFSTTVPLRGVIAWYGVSDLTAMAQHPNEGDGPTREDQWLGTPVLEAPELARAASPAAQARTGAPPFYLAHGADDTYVPVDQSRRLMLALLAVGVDAHLDVVPAAGHFWLGKDDTSEQFDAAIAFARSVSEAG